MADEPSWVKGVDVTLEKYWQIDILENNAGIGTLPDIEEEDESGWEKLLSVNQFHLSWHEHGRSFDEITPMRCHC